MDIEGAEYDALPPALEALCQVRVKPRARRPRLPTCVVTPTLPLTLTHTLTLTYAQGVDVLLLEMHARFFKERWRGHRRGFSTNLR